MRPTAPRSTHSNHPDQSNPQQQFSRAELMFFESPMADIAMLVADEEFEKRLKRGAPGAGGAGAGADEASKAKANFGAVTKVWGSWVESAVDAASGAKVHVALLGKADLAEPKTPVALAAFNGFFSA